MIQVKVKDDVNYFTCLPMVKGVWYDARLILWGPCCTEVRVLAFDMVVMRKFLEVRQLDS